ncbi:E3 ubiquitin-protein ligase NEURL1B isoform X1, partial [Astyanax mexicanus]
RFHPHAKGKNIRLDAQLRRATRRNSFCNGITFSQRPVRLYEKLRLRLSGVHTGWSGALRFGFTSLDPGDLTSTDIPKYACPDLVTRPGYWAKALPERLASRDNVLSFWADRHGRVFYSINEAEPVLFHCGLSVSGPLWAIIDIYGITQEAAAAKMATLQLAGYNQLSPCCSSSSSIISASSSSFSVQRTGRVPLPALDTDLHFHPVRGTDVVLSTDRAAACVHFLDSSRTLVFSDRPLRVGETLYLEVGHLGLPYFGALLFGMTSCDPGTLHAGELPADPDVLLDRKEYWVVYRGLPVPGPGDVLSFTLLSSGEVHHGVNGTSRGRLLCVDSSQVLWVFFALHGAVNRLRILGKFPLSVLFIRLISTVLHIRSRTGGECTVCFDQEVDTVIYTCGHLCLCNDCGLKLKRQINACCPICRRPIKDVIKTYRP